MPFKKNICIELWRHSGYKCAAPACRQLLQMPGKNTIGEAAHIHGEKKGSARYESEEPDLDRNSIENGIYLCTSCHRKVDSDPDGYPSQTLRKWKEDSYRQTLDELRPGRKMPMRGAVDILDERERAENYLHRHFPLYEIISDLFFYHSDEPNNIVNDFEKLTLLKNAIAKAYSMIKPFGIDRKDEYCYSEPCKGFQEEMERHLQLIRDVVPIARYIELDFRRARSPDRKNCIGMPALDEPISFEAKAFHRYRVHYSDFRKFLDNAENWKAVSNAD